MTNAAHTVFYGWKVCDASSFNVPQGLPAPCMSVKVYSKQNSIKLINLPFLLNWKLLSQCDAKKCIWYGRPFCSVKCVVVKLVFKMESICTCCMNHSFLYLFSFESFVLPAEHTRICQNECFCFESFPLLLLILLDLMKLIMLISNVFLFDMCKGCYESV